MTSPTRTPSSADAYTALEHLAELAGLDLHAVYAEQVAMIGHFGRADGAKRADFTGPTACALIAFDSQPTALTAAALLAATEHPGLYDLRRARQRALVASYLPTTENLEP